MTSVADLDTPAVTVDLDIMRDNIRRVQAHLARHGIGNRPHIKTHKIPAIGRMQMEAGAVGITCQKLGEVEVFVDAGVADDVLLTYNILGQPKTDRLMALVKRVRRLAVVLDNDVVARELSEAAVHAGVDVRFLVECDTGFGRTGVQTPDEAFDLARGVARFPRMHFEGLMTFPNRDPNTRDFFERALALFKQAGIAVPVVSGGGTPALFTAQNFPMLTEHRAGTCVYNDAMVVDRHRHLGQLRHARAGHGGEPADAHARDHRRRLQGADVGSLLHEGLRTCDGVSGGRRDGPLGRARHRRSLRLRRAPEGR